MSHKKCSCCKEVKELENFNKNINKKDGYHDSCKICCKEHRRIYYLKNKDKVKNNTNDYRLNNKEKQNKYWREYRKKNQTKIKNYTYKWVKNNKNKINSNRKNRRLEEPLFKLKANLRCMIWFSLKRNGLSKNSKTITILGCSFDEFKTYLESKFELWMNWDNYGLYNGELNYGWDLDHIIPLSSAKTEKDVIRLNHYTNLQPLCGYINRVVKKDKK